MRTTHSMLAIAAGILICSVPRSAPAQSGAQTGAQGDVPATVGGQVTDVRGIALPGARVDLTDLETGQTVETLARDDGRYTVQGLTIGHRYGVLIRCIGFAPRRENFTPADAAAAATAWTINVALTPLDHAYSGLGR